ncbi:MAG: SpoIID/LytB domain-containing protein [Lachnospirales bacterium]
MKKKFITMCLFFVFLLSSNILADSQFIRVGLERYYENMSEVEIENESVEFGYGDSFNNLGEVSGNITLKKVNNEFLAINKEFNNYSGVNNYVLSLIENGINACVGVTNAGGYYAVGYSADLNNSGYETINISMESSLSALYKGNKIEILFLNNGGQIRGINGKPIKLGEGYKVYRGRVEANIKDSSMTLVNLLTMNEYLYGTVPSEMPSEWPLEALKAQTLAARTFAEKNLNKHIEYGYNLCDDEHCQVYLGVNNESNSTKEAIDATRGEKIYYNNELIDAVYSSSSGGATANSEDVWTNKIPYLKEVKDNYDRTGKTWSRKITMDTMGKIVSSKGKDIGDVKSVTIGSKSDLGRVNELIINGSKGDYTLTKENIRYFFSYGNNTSLESRLFSITSNGTVTNKISTEENYSVYVQGLEKPVSDVLNYYVQGDKGKSKAEYKIYVKGKNDIKLYGEGQSTIEEIHVSGDEIYITGTGWGHGVGLSQHGAYGMAVDGYSYKDILKHYFTGVSIR